MDGGGTATARPRAAASTGWSGGRGLDRGAAAVAVLRDAVAKGPGPGPVLGELRISVADPDGAPDAVVAPPPSALPPGPLRIEAAMAAVSGRPLPVAAEAALGAADGARSGSVWWSPRWTSG